MPVAGLVRSAHERPARRRGGAALNTMIPVNRVAAEVPVRLDPESAEWLRVLGGAGPRREAALARLHEMLLRIAQREAQRRGPRMLSAGPELEDLAYQAAADAVMAITVHPDVPHWPPRPSFSSSPPLRRRVLLRAPLY